MLFDNPAVALAPGDMIYHGREHEPDRRLAVRAPVGSRQGPLNAVPAATAPAVDPLLTVRDLRIESHIGGQPHSIVTGIDLRRRPG